MKAVQISKPGGDFELVEPIESVSFQTSFCTLRVAADPRGGKGFKDVSTRSKTAARR